MNYRKGVFSYLSLVVSVATMTLLPSETAWAFSHAQDNAASSEVSIQPNYKTSCVRKNGHVTTLSPRPANCGKVAGNTNMQTRTRTNNAAQFSPAQAKRGLKVMLMAIGAECNRDKANCRLKGQNQ